MATLDTNEKLRTFMETVQRIVPPYGDMVQNGIPGEGQSNIAAERTQEMQRLAVYFARTYQAPAASIQEARQRASELEAALLTISTLGVISLERGDELIDDMHELLDNREV